MSANKENSQQSPISLKKFNNCGIYTYVTNRSSRKSFLCENLSNDSSYLKIAARDNGVQNYGRQEIKHRKIKLGSEIEGTVGRICEGVDGMQSFHCKT